jgi:hypothetical protein
LLIALAFVQVAWLSWSWMGPLLDLAMESGAGGETLSALLPATDGLRSAVDVLAGWPVFSVLRVGVFALIYLLLLALFVLYAGWVGMLARSVQRARVRKGD